MTVMIDRAVLVVGIVQTIAFVVSIRFRQFRLFVPIVRQIMTAGFRFDCLWRTFASAASPAAAAAPLALVAIGCGLTLAARSQGIAVWIVAVWIVAVLDFTVLKFKIAVLIVAILDVTILDITIVDITIVDITVLIDRAPNVAPLFAVGLTAAAPEILTPVGFFASFYFVAPDIALTAFEQLVECRLLFATQRQSLLPIKRQSIFTIARRSVFPITRLRRLTGQTGRLGIPPPAFMSAPVPSATG
jgi:hypothetical protein